MKLVTGATARVLAAGLFAAGAGAAPAGCSSDPPAEDAPPVRALRGFDASLPSPEIAVADASADARALDGPSPDAASRARVHAVAEEVFASVKTKYPPGRARCWWRDATLLWGVEQVYRQSPATRGAWRDYLLQSLDAFTGPNGEITPGLPDVDYVSCGINLLFAYQETGTPRYLTAARNLHAYMMQRFYRGRDGSISHVSSSYEYTGFVELWVDSDFLLLTFLARLAAATREPALVDLAARQTVLHIEHLMERDSGLTVHGWAEADTAGRRPAWADPHTGRNPVHWGRGNGWVMAGLSEVLSSLPRSHASYPFILESYQRAAAGLLAVRTPTTGMWKTVLTGPSPAGNVDETSGSALIAYGMATGVRAGWLDAATFGDAAERARDGLLGKWQKPDLTDVSRGTVVSRDPADYVSGFDLTSKYGEGAYLAYLSRLM